MPKNEIGMQGAQPAGGPNALADTGDSQPLRTLGVGMRLTTPDRRANGRTRVGGIPRGTSERLRPDNVVLVLVDFQVGPLWEPEAHDLRRDALRLAKAARLLGVPTVLTSAACHAWGPVVPELTEALYAEGTLERHAANPWDDAGVRRAIESTRPEHVVVAGAMTEIGVRYAALGAVERGYRVHVVVDVCGHLNDSAATTTILWMKRGGVRLTSLGALVSELGKAELDMATCDALALALRHPLPASSVTRSCAWDTRLPATVTRDSPRADSA